MASPCSRKSACSGSRSFWTGIVFCRVHRSYIVSLSHINYIERKRIRIGEELIPISDSYLPALMNKLSLQE